ncbi:MAG TPA: hypothetical protein PK712_06115 [Rectinema sp.]|nr:hypothetical protein [Rectinema sp.]
MKWVKSWADTSVITGEESHGKSKVEGPNKTKSSMTLSERVAELERKVAEHERRVSELEAKERARK